MWLSSWSWHNVALPKAFSSFRKKCYIFLCNIIDSLDSITWSIHLIIYTHVGPRYLPMCVCDVHVQGRMGLLDAYNDRDVCVLMFTISWDDWLYITIYKWFILLNLFSKDGILCLEIPNLLNRFWRFFSLFSLDIIDKK